jgi:GLPGLI family protein
MKKFSIILMTVVMFSVFQSSLTAQEVQTGTIKYQQITRYDFDYILDMMPNDQRTKEFVSGLPSESSNFQLLHFTKKEALFLEEELEKDAPPPGLQRAMHVENMVKPPLPKLLKVHYNLKKGEKLEQKEFLTRNFLISSKIETLEWKLTADRKKILDYTCMSAELVMDDQKLIAWFTPEIPISLGPAEFIGLPGIILAVERNGETAFFATEIILTAPSKDVIVKPEKGTKVTLEEFEAIKEEKKKEWEENAASRQRNNPHGNR